MSIWVLYATNSKKTVLSSTGYITYELALKDINKMIENGMQRIDEYKVYDSDNNVLYELKSIFVIKEEQK